MVGILNQVFSQVIDVDIGESVFRTVGFRERWVQVWMAATRNWLGHVLIRVPHLFQPEYAQKQRYMFRAIGVSAVKVIDA